MCVCVSIYLHTKGVVSIVVTRILLIIGASRRPGKEPLEESVQVFYKLNPGKWNSILSFILA